MSIGWYRAGTVSVTQNSSEIVGTGTYWLTAGLNRGDILKIDGVDYEVLSVTDNTHLTIAGTYAGTTGNGKTYAIVRNFTTTPMSKVARDLTDLMGLYEQIRDGEFLTLQGKSAYQIACDKGYVGTESEWVQSLKGDSAYQVAAANGYSGTESEWLESLKADNEWSTLNERTQPLLWNWKNSIYRGQSLGSTYDNDQLFTDARLGDYYTMNGKKLIVAGVRYCYAWSDKPCVTFIGETASQPRNSEEQDNSVTYGNSYWFKEYIPTYVAELYEFFGQRLMNYFIYVPTSFDGNTPSAYASLASRAHMITQGMLTGHSPYHAKYAHTSNIYCRQLPLLRLGYWLNTITADDETSTQVIHHAYPSPWTYSEKKQSTWAKYAVFHVCQTLNPN